MSRPDKGTLATSTPYGFCIAGRSSGSNFKHPFRPTLVNGAQTGIKFSKGLVIAAVTIEPTINKVPISGDAKNVQPILKLNLADVGGNRITESWACVEVTPNADGTVDEKSKVEVVHRFSPITAGSVPGTDTAGCPLPYAIPAGMTVVEVVNGRSVDAPAGGLPSLVGMSGGGGSSTKPTKHVTPQTAWPVLTVTVVDPESCHDSNEAQGGSTITGAVFDVTVALSNVGTTPMFVTLYDPTGVALTSQTLVPGGQFTYSYTNQTPLTPGSSNFTLTARAWAAGSPNVTGSGSVTINQFCCTGCTPESTKTVVISGTGTIWDGTYTFTGNSYHEGYDRTLLGEHNDSCDLVIRCVGSSWSIGGYALFYGGGGQSVDGTGAYVEGSGLTISLVGTVFPAGTTQTGSATISW